MTFNMNELASRSTDKLVEKLDDDIQKNIHGIGVDIASVDRMELAINRSGKSFLDRVFTQSEQDYAYGSEIPYQRFAACWAMKEAAVKALGTGFRYDIRFQDLELKKNESGQPVVLAQGRFKELLNEQKLEKIFASISHDSSYAIATVLIY